MQQSSPWAVFPTVRGKRNGFTVARSIGGGWYEYLRRDGFISSDGSHSEAFYESSGQAADAISEANQSDER